MLSWFPTLILAVPYGGSYVEQCEDFRTSTRNQASDVVVFFPRVPKPGGLLDTSILDLCLSPRHAIMTHNARLALWYCG